MEFCLGELAIRPFDSKKIKNGLKLFSPIDFIILPQRTQILDMYIIFKLANYEHLMIQLSDVFKNSLFIINSYYRCIANKTLVIELQNTSNASISINKGQYFCDVIKDHDIYSNIEYLDDVHEQISIDAEKLVVQQQPNQDLISQAIQIQLNLENTAEIVDQQNNNLTPDINTSDNLILSNTDSDDENTSTSSNDNNEIKETDSEVKPKRKYTKKNKK
jgi:hypothetical protein